VHDPFVPPGTLLSEYSLPSVDHSGKDVITYEVRHGHFSDATLRAYHARIQFFLLFFIDRSSFINDADPVWELLLIFQKRVSPPSRNNGALAAAGPTTTYHCVGYTTLYKFLSYPDDWKMRLSQILILPPYQRAGHGQKLLQLVYSLAEQRRAIEVNIEDPSPVFQLLRDLTDVNLCRKHRFFEKQPAAAAAAADGEDGTPEDPLDHWDLSYARRVKACLRLTMGQVRRCYEIFKLALQVNDRHNKTSKAMTAYRLEVKARLFKQEQEVLSLYSHKPEERKEKLAEMYNELEAHYLTVIKKARLH
jgi:histone acetyltransferase 1